MRKKWYVARRPKDLQAGVHIASKHQKKTPKMSLVLSLEYVSRSPYNFINQFQRTLVDTRTLDFMDGSTFFNDK